jgi:Methyltransferase domain/C-methyltransferase C-terminal domain
VADGAAPPLVADGADDRVTCFACGAGPLIPFADLGAVPVETGRHFASQREATASPVGRVVLGYCPRCAYVRNVVFDEQLTDPTAPTDMNLYHSPTFREFCSRLIADLSARLPLRGKRILEVGCAQGEFLRELCVVAGCTGIGYDASYTGPVGPDRSGADLRDEPAPIDGELPEYDVVISRFVLEHVANPYGFLVRLREQAAGRPVLAHVQVPDAGYDLATAGWEVIYPHVSYFDSHSLVRIAQRAGWWVERTGPLFSGMIRYAELSAAATEMSTGDAHLPAAEDRDRQIEAVLGFAERNRAERRRWTETISRLVEAGARPVLWGAGSRGVQLLNFADPGRRLAAVVDVNPGKWGRYLPVTGHRVDDPGRLADLDPRVVIITNPVYRDEIVKSMVEMGVAADILVA